jgi:hypothetical protein
MKSLTKTFAAAVVMSLGVAGTAMAADNMANTTDSKVTTAYQGIKNNPVKAMLESNGTLDVVREELTSVMGDAMLEATGGEEYKGKSVCDAVLSEVSSSDALRNDENSVLLLACDAVGASTSEIANVFNSLSDLERMKWDYEFKAETLPSLCKSMVRQYNIDPAEVISLPIYKTVHNVCNAGGGYPFIKPTR